MRQLCQTLLTYLVLFCFLGITYYPTVVLAYDLPEMGDSAVRGLTRAEEQELGDDIMRQIRQSPLYNRDPIVNSYVQSLGQTLVAASHRPTDRFEFFVINDTTVNAFAFPGGYVGLNTGLILTAQQEDEVAAVVAHEIAHVTQRHIARMFERNKALSLPMMAALLGSIALATISPAMGTGALAATMAGGVQDMINYTRAHEQEADRIGIEMLAKAGFDPNAMAVFFDRMAQANRYNDSFYVPDFLRTHPVTSARIADANARAENYAVPDDRDDLHFQLIKQRIQVLYTEQTQGSVAYYQAELKKLEKTNNPAWRYGYSLALFKNRDYKDAIFELDKLIEQDPHEKIYIMTLAEVYASQQQYAEATALLQNALAMYPFDQALTQQTVETLLLAQDYAGAKRLIEQYHRRQIELAHFYYLLAEAEAKLGNTQASHMARGEYFALRADYNNAVREYTRAQALNRDNDYQQARIQARLNELQEQL